MKNICCGMENCCKSLAFLMVFWGLTCESCSTGEERGRRHPENPTEVVDEAPENSAVESKAPQQESCSFKLYIENSASMNGFFNENAGAKDLRLSLFNMVQKLGCETVSFLNSKEIPVAGNAGEALKNLSLVDFRKYGQQGDPAASDISSVLQYIVDHTKAEGQISLLASDFIFSPSKANALTSLGPDAEKYSISNMFKGNDLSVAIFQLFATFDGQFFTGHFEKKGKSVQEVNYYYSGRRPYYVWAIGGAREIGNLMNRIDLGGCGVVNSLCLTHGVRDVKYNIVPRKGTYDIDKKDNHHACNAKMGKGGFLIDVIVDVGDLPLPKDFVCNPANYSTSNSNYVVENVVLRGGKYCVTLRGDRVVAGKLDVMLGMCLPQWVTDASLSDEWDIRKAGYAEKTFGVKAMVEGVMDAMGSASQDYYSLTIKIN